MLYLPTRNARHDEDRTGPDDHGPDAVTRLRPLLVAAGQLDLQDREGWMRLGHAARVVTAALAADGALPGHLAVGPNDPPALITRTIAAAWRHATAAPSHQIVEARQTDPIRTGGSPLALRNGGGTARTKDTPSRLEQA